MTEIEILHCLQEHCAFDEFSEESYYDDVVEPMFNYCTDIVDYSAGASKLVLFFRNTNFVIKIPFNGYYDEDGYFCEFTCAEINEGWDYCLAEMKIYRRAQKRNLEKFFAPLERIGFVDGYPIYSQPIVCTWSNSSLGVDKKDVENSKQFLREHSFGFQNALWLASAKKFYSEEEIVNLLYFLDSEELGDFHVENVGSIKIKGVERPILLDYAGWNDPY